MFISNRIRRIFAEFGHILPKAFCATPPSIVLRRSAEDSCKSSDILPNDDFLRVFRRAIMALFAISYRRRMDYPFFTYLA